MSIEYETLKQMVLEAARNCAMRGPATRNRGRCWTRLRASSAAACITRLDLDIQQAILTCWHDLFREGALSWGYDLDNPDPPFFHIPERTGPQQRPRR